MPAQAATKMVKFVERSPGWLRWGGGALLLSVGVVLSIGAVSDGYWIVLVPAAGMGLAAIWWCVSAKITAAVEGQTVLLSGPFWKRSLQLRDLHNVEVSGDSGLNPGPVNWPVVSLERGTLVRLNMGGSAVVSFVSDGRRYQFVLSSHHSAQRLAAALVG
ncbi:hypothetical protein [Arthrobacter sp. zg-Y750]|uniref:hypothetical protein n=1 Tax=Arthrobacter sp. zg-Y750 TaxID=2894189 RepID=UPI001E5AC4E7|nr:hypothetical protein [Arthrobacter sp. zg-Y750]MCC9177909.1 hypothetical protein [Arthrobacter sp. zg-Y750]